ncbi:MAG TPA: AAA family ATPase, partial [Candidatus Hodarchaeales archaeon]|nr:AAA family ATPase [Candidatus Hodarchaeales archaeon]
MNTLFSRHSCVPQLLRIENFRCFESIEIHFSPGINFLIGAGGSGKSSVIEAIHLLLSDISGQFETKYLYNSLRNTEKPAVIQLTANIFVSHEILDATEALSIPKAIRDALVNEKGTALTLKLIIEKTGTYTYHVNDLPLEEHWLSNWKSLLSGETFFSGVQKKNSIGSLKSIFMSDRSSEGRYQALLELLGYSEVVKKFTDIETRANELQITEQDIEARINNGKLIETQLEMGAGHFSELQ